jgi:hypothetical protein
MSDDDRISDQATATGILHCLRMLADEAASLHMTRTLAALQEAIQTCAAERSRRCRTVPQVPEQRLRRLH